MNHDLQSQIDRAKELFTELKACYEADLKNKEVSAKTRNITQEVLQKMRHLLDQAVRVFFDINYAPKLSESDKDRAKIYFPIVSNLNGLKSTLGRAMMGDLESAHPALFFYIESMQPYHPENNWLEELSKYANEKHIRLTPQKRIETPRVTVSHPSGALVSWGSGVTFGSDVSIMGVPIDPKTQLPVPNNLVQTKIDVWVSFMFENSNTNALGLCEKSIEDGEKIMRKILEASK